MKPELNTENRINVNVTTEKLIQYIKVVLVALLVAIEIAVCAYAVSSYVTTQNWGQLVTVIACCVALAVLESVNAFHVYSFAAKMVFYGVDTALLLVISIMTGNSFLSTLYCIVLTQVYMTIERFRDKGIIFCVSCGAFVTSFIIGWVFANPGAPIYNSVVEIITGALFGLIALVIDFIVVQFLLRFYRTNKELRAALKQADESRAQLKEVYEQLSKTAVYEERNRIAKDIHDNAGHSMTTVIMQTEAAKLIIDKDPEEAKNRIISANMQARNALEQMRESVHLLAGRELSQTLKEEIEAIISQTIDGTDLKVRCDIDDAAPSAEICRYLCNSLKECLANGVRHGKATAFYVELKCGNGEISMYVSDNGKGVDGKIKPGFGLKGLKDKAAALGGTCELSSELDEGFEVLITLPYEHKKEEL